MKVYSLYPLLTSLVGTKAGKEFLYALDVPEADRQRVKRIRAAVLFIESYRELPLLAWPRLLLDKVAELEEKLVLFRCVKPHLQLLTFKYPSCSHGRENHWKKSRYWRLLWC